MEQGQTLLQTTDYSELGVLMTKKCLLTNRAWQWLPQHNKNSLGNTDTRTVIFAVFCIITANI